MTLSKKSVVTLAAAGLALTLAACSSGSSEPTRTETVTGSAPAAQGSSSSAQAQAPSTTAPAKTPVKLTTLNSDGVTYGVGMPVIVYFSRTIKDGKAFQAGTKVTADGKPLEAAWYFQQSSISKNPIEAQLRPKEYWPAHSKIHIDFPKTGTALGGNYALSTKLTSLDFEIGAKRIITVDNSDHQLTYVEDGKKMAEYPVSLGASDTRTKRGIKVIMEKGRDISMRGPGYYDPSVKWTQRLTFGGEYLHAAPWNTRNINNGVNSSNGCTNLMTSDAKQLYDDLRVGDVVTYPNANGPKMQIGQGYGLWNVNWNQYLTGGLVPTR